MAEEIQLVDLTLENVSNGALEGRFQELLAQVEEINESALAYVGGTDGSRVTKITLEIEFRHRPAMGGDPASTVIVSGGEITRRPKRNKTSQPVYRGRDGGLVVMANPPEQASMFEGEGAGGTLRPFPVAAGGERGSDVE